MTEELHGFRVTVDISPQPSASVESLRSLQWRSDRHERRANYYCLSTLCTTAWDCLAPAIFVKNCVPVEHSML